MDKYLNKTHIFLIAVFLLALFLRTYNIKHTLLFHYDQGYHGLAIKSIWDNKKLTLLGHKTDVEGIFHSSLYYYLMLPLYLISNWNPAGVSTILATIDAFSIFFIYLTAKKLFNKQVGLISSFTYAVSYSIISYARWLSNVTLIPFLASLVFFFLALCRGEKVRFFVASAFIVGVIAQLNGAIGFFLLPLLILYLFHFRKNLISQKINLIKYFIFYIFPSIGLILFDLRNNFLVSKSIMKLFIKGKVNAYTFSGLSRATNILINQAVNLLSFENVWLTIAILLLVIYAYQKIWKGKSEEYFWAKTVLIGSSVYILQLFLYQGIHDFFIVGGIPLFILTIGWGIFYCSRKNSLKYITYFILGMTLLVNLHYWKGFLKPNINLVPIGTSNLITLEDRLKATDFMYHKAKGEPFRVIIYIIPYYQEQPWDYVFNWYGFTKYRYLPDDGSEMIFTIHEPDYDYEYRLTEWLKIADKEYGDVVSIFNSNSLTVEERGK